MPSKRKKNKRRMRRVQAQRRALEEQHVANPPIKASPGIAVSAPPTATTPKKVPKTAAPPSETPPQAVPITVPIVETPKVEPKPVVPEPVAEPVAEPVLVEVAAAQPDVKLLQQVSAEVEVEAQAHVTEEPLGEWTPPVEPSTDEAGVGQEAEPNVPETEPVSEVNTFGVPAATEIQTVDPVSITQTELMQPETEEVAEIFSGGITECKVELEVAITEDISAPEPVKETSEEPAVEDLSDQVSADGTQTDAGSVVEAVAEIPGPEQVTESISPAAPTQETEEEVEVSAEENTAEPVTTAEDAPVQSVEIPEVKDAIPDASEEADEVVETKEGLEDLVVDDAAVTEPVSAVEGAVAAAADIHQEFGATSDNVSTQKESIDVIPAYPEPAAVAAPAAEEVTSDAAEQTCLKVSSEEPKSEACEATCHMQLPVESVELSSVEISVETTLNGHIVPEVSIEG